MPETIGFIGLGLMEKPMAANLLKAGYPVVVHSRSQGPVDELVAVGARRGTSPFEVMDPEKVIHIGGPGAGQLYKLCNQMVIKPGFKTHLFAKDMRNVVSTPAENDCAAPVTAVVQQLLHATMAAGRGEDDNSIMARTVFDIAGVK
jgi:3-hydroxyisobutyrate dehydrogenase-like beta-hydroxyacid dehydrogenase